MNFLFWSDTFKIASIIFSFLTLLCLIGNFICGKIVERQKNSQVERLEKGLGQVSLTSPKIDLDGRIAVSPYVWLASEFSDGIVNARAKFTEGKLDEAFEIARALTIKKADFGLAYFIMGTVEAERGNFQKSQDFILLSLKYGLPNSDKAWAYHNLGIIALRQNKLEEAISYFDNCLEINSEMKDTRELKQKIETVLKNH